MSKYDLSILIPARNEAYLAQTVKGILESRRGKTEVIVVLDGAWADPALDEHPDVTVLYNPESVGQRAATNQAAKLSKAKYVMKLDAHCALDEGFDVKLIDAFNSLPDGDNCTIVPALYNLHVFDWKCKKCGNRWYQSPTPGHCMQDGSEGQEGKHENPNCDSKEFEKVMVWNRRENRRNEFYRFDTSLHFQYHGIRAQHPEAQGNLAETMSIQGSCFVLTREKYWELNICDEEFGSWGQQGVEVACKTWLSGGRVLTCKDTWYAHLFRTQGGDFGFPYPLNQKQVDHARELSKELFLKNTWEKQIHPLSWLIEKFYPLQDADPKKEPDWHTEGGKKMLDLVNEEGKKFYDRKGIIPKRPSRLTKGIIYYTDNQLKVKISKLVQKHLLRMGLPIVSVSLKPMDFGKNIVVHKERGYEAYFTQILTALENIDTDIVYFCEHDWLYHPSHFKFTPEDEKTFYYNWNWWRVRAADGHAVHYNTQLLPGICAYREVLLEYYRKQLELLKAHKFDTKYVLTTGFEPGTHNRVPELSGYKTQRFDSEFPNIDIRHTTNLTSSKWSQDEFRNPKNAEGWIESSLDKILGWNLARDTLS